MVTVKVLKSTDPTPGQIYQLENELALTRHLQLPGIRRTFRKEQVEGKPALVMAYVPGNTFKRQFFGGGISLETFFSISRQCLEILESIHDLGIVHRDINNNNFIYNPDTGRVTLIDFEIAVKPDDSRNDPFVSGVIGTLPYLAPEQTGRLNRKIDGRADLYSLGIAWYELLAGKLPFQARDANEWVHAHLAQTPVSLHLLTKTNLDSGQIPEALAKIIDTLLMKDPDDRFPSAQDVLPLLSRMEAAWTANQSISSLPDNVWQTRVSLKNTPQLFGRNPELRQLEESFIRVSEGEMAFTLITGTEGVGKSALASHIRNWVNKGNGFFIQGNFDAFNNSPYQAILKALQDFVNQLLTQNASQLEFWKHLLLEAVGENGQLLTEVVPALRLIIGDQSLAAGLAPADSQNRFRIVLREVIRTLSGKGHPLILFLDSAQWIDQASEQMLESLVNDANNPYTWIIMAYRTHDEDADADNLLQWKQTAISQYHIPLQNLNVSHIASWLSAILEDSEENVQSAAQVLYDKTHGNPLFLSRLIREIHHAGYIHRNSGTGRLEWDLPAIRSMYITDNVVDLMAARIAHLPETTIHDLELASCIGVEFPVESLQILHSRIFGEETISLEIALKEGLILEVPDGLASSWSGAPGGYFKFAHEGLRKALYERLTAEARKKIHLAIARLMEESIPESSRDQFLFDAVNHWNQATPLLSSREEKKMVAELNLQAGRRAYATGAYHAANVHAQQGLDILGSFSWEQHYQLNLNLGILGAESAYLAGDFGVAAGLAQRVEQQTVNIEDRVRIWDIQLRSLTSKNQLAEATNLGLSLLLKLGYPIPAKPRVIHYLLAQGKSSFSARRVRKHRYNQLPEMENPKVVAALQVIFSMSGAASIHAPALMPLLVYLEAYLTFRYGRSPFAPTSIINYGISVAIGEKQWEKGFEIGSHGFNMLSEVAPAELLPGSYASYFAMLWPLRNRIHEAQAPLLEAYKLGIKHGDIANAAFCLIQHVNFSLIIGQDLTHLLQEVKSHLEFARKRQLENASDYFSLIAQTVENLITPTEEPWIFNGDYLDETKTENPYLHAKDRTGSQAYYYLKAILAYHFEQFETANEILSAWEKFSSPSADLSRSPFLLFNRALIELSIYTDLSENRRNRVANRIEAYISRLEKAAASSPANFAHKAKLVQAEWNRIQGLYAEARPLYEAAISLARENEFLGDEALANELLGRYFREQDQPFLAEAYLQRAWSLYERWGAKSKLAFLAQRYPRYIGRAAWLKTFGRQQEGSSSADHWSGLDLESITKATQALSGEVVLSSLLEKLLLIVMENAGAERAAFIEIQDDKLMVLAQGTVDGGVEVRGQKAYPVDEADDLPGGIIRYTARTLQPLVLANASQHPEYQKDAYVMAQQPYSVLCYPVLFKGQLTALLYLENNLAEGAFTEERVEVLRILSAQMAISIENARLYEHLDEKVRARTFELNKKNEELAQTLEQLQSAQNQLIQSEKMASLGQLTAGIAHEINNPINFISGNVSPLSRNLQELFQLYEMVRALPNAANTSLAIQAIEAFRKSIDADFLFEEIDLMLTGIRDGTTRTQQIVAGLQHFSRSDEARFRKTDLHEALESTLTLLNTKIRDRITVERHYGDLPLVDCLPGKLNQVFLNILSNAAQAIPDKGTITLTTRVVKEHAEIVIRDSGSGMPPEVQNRIFEPFFTTKDVGQGTGLGLSITYGIVEQHKGKISVSSTPGEGSAFTLAIPLSQPDDLLTAAG